MLIAFTTSLQAPPIPMIFNANRPFFYMILSKNNRIGTSNIPLFQGNVQF